MAAGNSLPLLPLLLALLNSVHSSDWWMEEPYGNDEFNVLGKYGENATLVCEDYRRPLPDDIQYWVLPDLTVMNRTDYREFQTLDGPAGWYVEADGSRMLAFLIQERHFGFYHCVFYNRSTDNVEVIKKGLNYKGPYFGDLWPTYEKAVIIGCTAAGICIVLFTVLCVLYELRFHSDSPTDDDRTSHRDSSGQPENDIDAIGLYLGSISNDAYDGCYNNERDSKVTQRKVTPDSGQNGGKLESDYTWL